MLHIILDNFWSGFKCIQYTQRKYEKDCKKHQSPVLSQWSQIRFDFALVHFKLQLKWTFWTCTALVNGIVAIGIVMPVPSGQTAVSGTLRIVCCSKRPIALFQDSEKKAIKSKVH